MAKTKLEQTNPIMPSNIQKGQFDQFFKLIQQRIDHYESNKGFFRKHFSFLKYSDYMDDLIKVNNGLQNKVAQGKDLTLNDMRWFYEKCYGQDAKYASPDMRNGTSLSARIYQVIGTAINKVYPEGKNEFKSIREQAQVEAREYRKEREKGYQEGENIHTFEGSNPGFDHALNTSLSKTILWPQDKATSPSLAPETQGLSRGPGSAL